MGTSVFPSPQKPTFCKFQFDLDYCQALSHEPLALEIVQGLPVLLTLNSITLLYFTLMLFLERFFLKQYKMHHCVSFELQT